MKSDDASFVGNTRDRQRGQTLVMAALLLVALLGATALVIDAGALYYSYQELVAATDAAALAGASNITNGNASDVAAQYSATPGGLNNRFNLHDVSVSVSLKCLSTAGIGLPSCVAYGSQPAANAIAVTEHAVVPTYFAKVFGIQSLNIAATATAAKGGTLVPAHVMLLLDATASMNDLDRDSQCNGTRLSCAETGIRTLLATLDPCPMSEPACVTGSDTSGNPVVTNAVDQVGLMAFPGLTPPSGSTESGTVTDPPAASSEASSDYTCSSGSYGSFGSYGSSPQTVAYNENPAYLILPLGSNYRTSNTTSTLNTSSDMVTAVGGNNSCSGMSAPGGQGTFYAGAISAAQRYLLANSAPGVPNVLVFLSDGSAGNGNMSGSMKPPYPSPNQCTQAVNAANAAKEAGIDIYAVAYGAESSGCSTGETITPCQTMEKISGPSQDSGSVVTPGPYFFSDYTATGGTSACVSASYPTTNLKLIFAQIGEELGLARLLPNSTP